MKVIIITHKTSKGKLIGRANFQPPINSIVVLKNNKKFRKVGKVHDVFGPINRPYVKIIPFKGFENYIGEAYILKQKNGKSKYRKK
ncbi:Gar1/Naf1 family protein [Methanotorris formicicus]|uniref:H/ACA RNA-protein complex component Gar1 n=1 Tax=Methanotorris formicicus Mc-S-70 TaxID=647171 RepID=H1KYE4_9EURY|nr:Gar1/Naf1 family protein [Methanotorris formicicus]EHP87228.1 hypothetical protein MetfoDRAFT_0817 [Methanotorris formicicus Mc-S-70]